MSTITTTDVYIAGMGVYLVDMTVEQLDPVTVMINTVCEEC